MPSSEDRNSLEQFGTPYPGNGHFAALLDWHLNRGTRPKGQPSRLGQQWTNKEFAGGIGLHERVIRNWRTGRSRPNELPSIERELFGNNSAYDSWRLDLRAAYDNKAKSNASVFVPRPTNNFLGRDTDVAVIIDTLMANPSTSVLLQGGPGIGKTTLTQAVAVDPKIIEHFGESSRWFVKLETATTAVAMQDAVMRGVGCDPTRGFRAALATLANKGGLLILDNLETPWEPKTERSSTEKALADLSTIRGLSIIASFRGRDHVGGPNWTMVHTVTSLTNPTAEELFCRIARSKFTGDQFKPEFTKALGGIPLAIELVARRAFGRESLAELWSEWIKIGAALAEHPDFDRSRLTSLSHSIELSLGSTRMTPLALRLFSLLGQLPGGLNSQDRDILLGEGSFQAEEALIRTGLAFNYRGRLDMLPPIRDHAARHHIPKKADSLPWAGHYLALTRQLGETIGTTLSEGAVPRLKEEFANIESAFRFALRSDRRESAMSSFYGFANLAGVTFLPTPIFGELAESCQLAGDIEGTANCTHAFAQSARIRADYDTAIKANEYALSLFRKIGDTRGEAHCILGLGEVALDRSDYDTARIAFERALPLYKKIGSTLSEANCRKSLGHLAMRRSDLEAAQKAFKEALPLYQQINFVLGEANCIEGLGHIAYRHRNFDMAWTAFDKAAQLYRQFGDILCEANCLKGQGDIALAYSQYDAAKIAYEEAVKLYRDVGSLLGEANCILGFANLELSRKHHDAAHAAYSSALTLYRRTMDVVGEAHCILRAGDIELARGHLKTAKAAYEQALALYQRIGVPSSEAECNRKLNELASA